MICWALSVCECVRMRACVSWGTSLPHQLVRDSNAMATGESHESQNVCKQSCRYHCPSVHLILLFSLHFCMYDFLLTWALLICPSVHLSTFLPVPQSVILFIRMFIDPLSSCRSINHCWSSISHFCNIYLSINLSICESLTLLKNIEVHQQKVFRHKREKKDKKRIN